MIKTIGWLMVLNHDIHYGYEGGQYINFTIESKEPITQEEIRVILEKHFNEGMSIDKRKSEWLDFMPEEDDYNCELTFDKFNEWASQEVNITI
jgi:hypothetical protein